MLNLLPFIEKKKVRTEYRLRLAIVVVFVVGVLVFINSVLLIPSYVRAFSKHSLAEQQLAKVTGRADTEKVRGIAEKEASLKIKEINRKLNLFNVAKNATSTETHLIPSEALRKIIGLKTSAIKISGITYDVGVDHERFVVTGKSLDRESLALFVDTLKKDGTFTSVDLPISSYVKSIDIEFSIAIERKYKVGSSLTKQK